VRGLYNDDDECCCVQHQGRICCFAFGYCRPWVIHGGKGGLLAYAGDFSYATAFQAPTNMQSAFACNRSSVALALWIPIQPWMKTSQLNPPTMLRTFPNHPLRPPPKLACPPSVRGCSTLPAPPQQAGPCVPARRPTRLPAARAHPILVETAATTRPNLPTLYTMSLPHFETRQRKKFQSGQPCRRRPTRPVAPRLWPPYPTGSMSSPRPPWIMAKRAGLGDLCLPSRRG
jgi:hypothetical protein